MEPPPLEESEAVPTDTLATEALTPLQLDPTPPPK